MRFGNPELCLESQAKVPSSVLSLLNKQASKQTNIDTKGLDGYSGTIFLEFQKKIPGQVVVNLSSSPEKANGERRQLCFKTCRDEHLPQGREPDFRKRARKPTVPEEVYLCYGWHPKEKRKRKRESCSFVN